MVFYIDMAYTTNLNKYFETIKMNKIPANKTLEIQLAEIRLVVRDYVSNIFIKLYLLFQTAARLSLCAFAFSRGQVSISEMPLILLCGAFSDFISSFFFAPVVVFLQRIELKYLTFIGRIFFSFLFSFVLIFSAVSQIAFWDEFSTNFNFIAVDYLIYTHEIIGTLKDSMPLYEIIISIILLSIFLALYIYKNSFACPKPSMKLAFASAIGALTLGQFYNSDNLGFANNRFAHEIAKNGPYEFVHAYYNNSLDYTKFYKSEDSSKALDFVRGKLQTTHSTFLSNDSIDRNVKSYVSARVGNVRPNILLITIESMSAEYMEHFGNKRGITPELDALADEGMFFTNIYATGTRTVRGLEALTIAIPPIPGSSVLRRPNNHNLFTIGSALRSNGWKTDFIYGGYSYFDNMKNYFEGNGFNVIDRSDIAHDKITFSNAWGVADENLFDKALETADLHYSKGERFFSLIMTTSNHRPYNFPEGKIDLKPGVRDSAVKYTDYAVGRFIEMAKTKPWFKDTIFVITADHCASSAGKVQLPANKYRIPLIIYGPGVVPISKNNDLASQIDIPPTILGMIDINYSSKFFGQDIIHNPPGRAFISTYQLLGYIKEDKLVVLAPNAEPVGYFLEGNEQKMMAPDEGLIRESVSYYQSAYELLVNGKIYE